MKRISLITPIFLVSCLSGCTVDDVDKWVANSTALAKEQTTVLLEDNKDQTQTLSEQHALMAPELAAKLESIKMNYDLQNAKNAETITNMHHEISKVSEDLEGFIGNITNTVLGILGVGGIGGAFAVGKKKKVA